jgi:hypothetical protein
MFLISHKKAQEAQKRIFVFFVISVLFVANLLEVVHQ